MKKRLIVGLTIGLVTLCVYGLAQASNIIIDDHFDDNTLDSAWSIRFDQVTEWSYQESGTTLEVTDITTTGTGWSSVNLTQYFTPLSDFSIDFGFSWNSESNFNSMQNVLVQAYSQDGNKIAVAGYSDGWIGSEGAKYGSIGETSVDTGPGTVAGSGSAIVKINRTGSNIKILWDDSLLISGTSSDLLYRIDLVFSHHGGSAPSFGSEAVDFIKVQEPNAPVPEPATMLLFGIGLIGLAGVNRKKIVKYSHPT